MTVGDCMNKLNSDIFLSDVFKHYPGTMEVFLANGFDDFADSDAFMEIGEFVKLKTILKARKIDEKGFLKLLEDKISSDLRDSKYHQFSINDKLNMLALLPCPLKLPIEEAFNRFIGESKLDQKVKLNYLIEGNANNQLSYYTYVDQFSNIGEIPDIVISPGINSFYYNSFVEKFIDRGLFVDAAQYAPNERLGKIGIKDPKGNYTIISMNLLVMVVDKLSLGNNSMPREWGDLLSPQFEKKIAIRGQNNFFCETTLLTIYKYFGIEGIKKFGKSVKYGWHPAQMAKMAGSGSQDSPTISIMPYFYTKMIKNKENVEVIWPLDGAIISPVTMLVKADKAEQLKQVTEFFTGPEVGRISAAASFPTMHPDVDNNIPESAVFNWIGWDVIKQNDLGNLVKVLNSEFMKCL